MIPAVIDTNIVLSAAIAGGRPLEIIRLVENSEVSIITSNTLIAEVNEVLNRKKFRQYFEARRDVPQRILDIYLRAAVMVETIPDILADAVRDPKDLKFLAVAVGGNADYLITGDEDLLSLGVYQNVKIVTPAYFLNVVIAEQR